LLLLSLHIIVFFIYIHIFFFKFLIQTILDGRKRKYSFFLNSKKLAYITQVGGKGYSLIKLNSLDLNVPPGIVLTIEF